MDYNVIKEKMNNSVENLKVRFSEIRAGRANPAILNKIKVDYYGVPTPVNQVAGVSVPEARLIVIQPWDVSILKEIEKAILEQKDGEMTEDEEKQAENKIQEMTDKAVEEIDKITADKEREVLSI